MAPTPDTEATSGSTAGSSPQTPPGGPAYEAPPQQAQTLEASHSLGADAWRRLKKNRLAMVSLFVVGFIAFVGYSAPILWAPHVTHFSPTADQNQPLANRPPGTKAVSATYPTYDGDAAGFAVIDLDKDGFINCRRTQWADGTPGPLECPELRLATLAARFYDDLFADYDLASGDAEPVKNDVVRDGFLTWREYPKDDEDLAPHYRGLGLAGPDAFRNLDIDGDHVVARWEVVERARYVRYTSFEASGARTYAPFIMEHDEDGDLRLSQAEYPGAPELHTFLLGTDNAGRDVLTRLIYGARLSITIGLLSTFVSLLIGVLYGAISGYAGGRVDNVMMRLVDILYGLPFMFLVILIMAIVQDRDDPVTVFVLLGCVQWLTTARVVRGQVLSLKNREFIEAQRALGAGRLNIVLKHLIPNALGPVVVYATLLVPAVILEEAFLSFLGLGLSDSWGKMISEGANITSLGDFPWQIVFPGLALAVTLFCLNFLGDGVRDAMDPQLRGKK